MKIAPKFFPLAGLAVLGLLVLSSCEVVDMLSPGMDLLTQETVEVDGGEDDGGEVDGGGSDGEVDGGGEALVEAVDCGDAVPCGMVMNDRDLPCSAIDGGICDPDGCCEPGLCQGPNQAFFEAIGRDCPQGADQDGCCIRGRSADAPGQFCPDGPKCREDHPSGLHLPCVAINGGECVEGCCDPGPCKGPSVEFFQALGFASCPQGEPDIDGCCNFNGGGDDGVDGDSTGGDSTGTGTADGL